MLARVRSTAFPSSLLPSFIVKPWPLAWWLAGRYSVVVAVHAVRMLQNQLNDSNRGLSGGIGINSYCFEIGVEPAHFK
jgi:hypothetical protein